MGSKKTVTESEQEGGPYYAVAKHLTKPGLLSGISYYGLLLHSPTGGLPSCSQVLRITHKDATNILVRIFIWTYAFTSLGQNLGVKWLDFMAAACLNCKETEFSKMTVHFCIFTSNE